MKNGDNYEFINFLEEVPPYPGDESVFDSPYPSPQYAKPSDSIDQTHLSSHNFPNNNQDCPPTKIKQDPLLMVRPEDYLTPIGCRTRSHQMMIQDDDDDENYANHLSTLKRPKFSPEKHHHHNYNNIHLGTCSGGPSADLPLQENNHHHLHQNQQQQHHHQNQNQHQNNNNPQQQQQQHTKQNRKRKTISPAIIANKIKTEQESISLSREELLSFSSEQFEDFVMQITAVRDLSQSEKNEIKRQRRLIKNRESAQASRQRKKSHIDELERKVKDLGNENIHLKEKISSLDHENTYLKKELSQLKAFVNKLNRHL
jgi:hypothetical protein